MNEVAWFRRSSGGFSGLVEGRQVCFEPTDQILQSWADSLSDEEAEELLVQIWEETHTD